MIKNGIAFLIFASLILINVARAEITYQAPLQITQGGSYSGNWKSTSINTPAVNILTKAPVIIQHCRIEGPGPLIATIPGAHLTLQNCFIDATNPQQKNLSRGRVLNGIFSYLVVENNLFEHTGGMSIWNMTSGDPTSHPSPSSAVIQIKYNRVKNLDGRLENGGSCGSFIPSPKGQPRIPDDHCHVNFAGIIGFLSDPHIEIAWNEIVNQPHQSAMGDVIMIMSSSGVSAKQPILIHDNFIQGVYGGAPSTDFHYGGTGINAGDYLQRLKNPAYVSAFVNAFNNQVVGPAGWGMCLVAGHDITIQNNRVIRSGFLPDNTPMPYTAMGLMMVDLYRLEPPSQTPINDNNKIINNVIGYVSQNNRTRNQRFDYEFYGPPGGPNLQCVGKVRQAVNACCTVEQNTARVGANVTCSPNINYKYNPAQPNEITLKDEMQEMQRWKQKLASHHIQIGPH